MVLVEFAKINFGIGLLGWIIVGLIAGWLAHMVMGSGGGGCRRLAIGRCVCCRLFRAVRGDRGGRMDVSLVFSRVHCGADVLE